MLPDGDDAALYYGALRVHLEKQGTSAGSLHMLIAAHALSIALTTNNEKEFNRVPNLTNSYKRLKVLIPVIPAKAGIQ